MASNPIGDIPVIISGDFSELSDAIDQAVSAATSGASDIADALDFSSLGDDAAEALQNIADAAGTAGSQVSSLGTDADTMSDSLDGLSSVLDSAGDSATSMGDSIAAAGDAASGAADSISSVGDAADESSGSVEELGESGEEAGGQLAELAEQMTAVGEALVITEGFHELGQEALEAAGTVQSVTIGLTALTGSATEANEVIEQVKNLAATEPFAFPEIAPTVQKMIALGVSTEEIPTVMQAAADASAATGNSFQQVANSIDRMTLSGTAGSRQLVQLGVSTSQLAQIMGVSDNEFKQAFADLDQSQRLDVLTQALSKFAGTAIAEAQGISGQWQIFQNDFEEVMVAVGTALTPVVGDILSFGKEVLGAVQAAVEAFGELPQPVQDVIVVIGLLAAAAVPVTAALAAIGIGMSGLQTLIPTVQALFATLTGAEEAEAEVATESVAAHAAAATAIEAEGAAATTAATELSESAVAGEEAATAFGLAGTAAGLLEGGLAALGLVAVAYDLKTVAADAQDFGSTLNGVYNITGTVKDALSALAQAEVQAAGGSESLSAAWGTVKADFSDEASNASLQVVPGLEALHGGLVTATADIQIFTNVWPGMTAAIASNLSSLEAANAKISELAITAQTAGETVSGGVQKIVTAVNTQNAAVQSATAVFNTLNAAYQSNTPLADGTVVTAQMLAAAHKALATALSAATDALKAHNAAAVALSETYPGVVAAAQKLTDSLNTAQTTYDKAFAAYQNGTGSLVALAIAAENLDKQTDAYNKTLAAVVPNQTAETTEAQATATALQSVYGKITQTNQALETAIQVYNQVSAAQDGSATQSAALVVATNNLVNAYKAANPTLVTAKGNIQDYSVAAIAAAQADASYQGAHQTMVGVIANGHTTMVAVKDDFQNAGTAAQTAATQVPDLGVAYETMTVKVDTGDGIIETAIQTVKNLGVAAEANAAQIQNGPVPAMNNWGTSILDFTGGIYKATDGVTQLQTETDIFNTSQIKVTTSTQNATAATADFGQTIINTDGSVTNLTALLATLATSYDAVATAANNAASAETNESTASAKGGSGSKSGDYLESTTGGSYQESAQSQELQAEAGPFAMGSQFNFGIGSPPPAGVNPGGAEPFIFGNGGIVTQTTLGILGESGPEAVIPLTGDALSLMEAAVGAPIPQALPDAITGIADTLSTVTDAASSAASILTHAAQSAEQKSVNQPSIIPSGVNEYGPSNATGISPLQALANSMGISIGSLLQTQQAANAPTGPAGTSAIGLQQEPGNYLALLQQQSDQQLASQGPQSEGTQYESLTETTGNQLALLTQALNTSAYSQYNQGPGVQSEGASFSSDLDYAPSYAGLSAAQLQQLLNSSTIPGQGFTGGGSGNPPPGSAPVSITISLAGAHVYGTQGAAQLGTTLVNTLRQNASQLKF